MGGASRFSSKNATMGAALALITGAAFSGIAHGAETQAAGWASKEVSFTYQGFTTKYSCDGLHDKVRAVLLKLGARKDDLKVRRSGCTSGSGTPDPFPGVSIKAMVLQPAGADEKSPVQAEWQAVEFRASPTAALDRGDCELVEQLRDKVLPIFTTRNVEVLNNCVPHQMTAGGMMLKLDVLKAKPEKTSK